MANSVEIGCESGSGNSQQVLFEAIKTNGTYISLSSGSSRKLNLSGSSYAAFGLKANNKYAVAIGRSSEARSTPGVACSIPVQDQYGNTGHIYFGMVNSMEAFLASSPEAGSSYTPYNTIECYYIKANTYDELMSQLGGGHKTHTHFQPKTMCLCQIFRLCAKEAKEMASIVEVGCESGIRIDELFETVVANATGSMTDPPYSTAEQIYFDNVSADSPYFAYAFTWGEEKYCGIIRGYNDHAVAQQTVIVMPPILELYNARLRIDFYGPTNQGSTSNNRANIYLSVGPTSISLGKIYDVIPWSVYGICTDTYDELITSLGGGYKTLLYSFAYHNFGGERIWQTV